MIFFHGCDVHEIALLTLQEARSLSVYLYASAALTFRCRQVNELNACWNDVIRRIFAYQRCESVKAVIRGLGRVNVKCPILLQLHEVNITKIVFRI